MSGEVIIGRPEDRASIFGKENCIDLRHILFMVDGHMLNNWHIPYCKTALYLAQQGYDVYVDYCSEVISYFVEFLDKHGKPQNVRGIVLLGPRDEILKAVETTIEKIAMEGSQE